MTFVNSLSQIPSEKQVWKKLRQIVFGKKVKCPDCGRQKYVKEIQKDKMFRCTKCHNGVRSCFLTFLSCQ